MPKDLVFITVIGKDQKGVTRADARLIDSLPDMLSRTERVCAFLNVASTVSSMNMDAL